MRPDPKPAARVVDPGAVRRARLGGDCCAACGRPPGSVHHVVPRGAPHHGDDVPENLLLLCGTGTSGCHGAWHGSPYYGGPAGGLERRDADWVARRVGRHLAAERPDAVRYVLGKLGRQKGRYFLERRYRLVV